MPLAVILGSCVGDRMRDRKKQENDLQEHQNLQQELLTAAITLAKPGGVVVYSTCSVEPEETIMVLDQVLATHPGVHHENVREYLPDPIFEEFVVDGNLILLPGDLGMDGFFIARLRT